MAKSSSHTLAIGAAVAVGGWFLWKKYGAPSVTAITDSGQAIDVPLTPSGQVDTTSAAYLTAVAQGVSNYVANNSTPAGCQNTPYGPVCPSNFNNPTLTPPTPVCGAGYKLTASKTACEPIVCPSGYRLNAAGTDCELIPVVAPPPPPVVTPPTPSVYDTGVTRCTYDILYTQMSDGTWKQIGSCAAPKPTNNFECRGNIIYQKYTDGSWQGLGIDCGNMAYVQSLWK